MNGLPKLLSTTAVELVTLPDGTTFKIAKAVPTFPSWNGEPLADTYGGKPLLDWGGEPVFAELYILRLLERDGWSGAWIDTYRDRTVASDGVATELPSSRQDLLLRIYEASGSTSGCFDVYAWKGNDILFAEAKRGGKDQIRDSQLRWLDAAIQCGVTAGSLIVVEWTAGYEIVGRSMKPSARMQFESIREGDPSEVVRISDGIEDRTVLSELDASEGVNVFVHGTPRPGETGNLRVARQLIEVLNANGRIWGDPELVDRDDVDVECAAVHGDEELHIQVTRAYQSEEFWSRVRTGATLTGTVHDMVEIVREVVERKANSYGRDQLPKLTLVLDAIDTPAVASPQLAVRFRCLHGDWIRSLGFKAVWVVGPSEKLVHRLDLLVDG